MSDTPHVKLSDYSPPGGEDLFSREIKRVVEKELPAIMICPDKEGKTIIVTTGTDPEETQAMLLSVAQSMQDIRRNG